MSLIIYFIFLFVYLPTLSSQKFKRVCYLKSDSDIPIDYIIGTDLCSHIIIGFVSVIDNVVEVDDTNHKFYLKCKSTLDSFNSQTLLMVSIGGGNNERGFHSAALTPQNRKVFSRSVIDLINKYGLQGIDLDWEFPSWGNLWYEDKNRFNLLLKDLRETFDVYSQRNRTIPLVLSAAVAAQYTIIERSYDIPELMKHVDFINLMTYDYYIFHWYWPFVGHNSPLFPRSLEIGLFGTFNTEWSANYWNEKGADKSKIMVGIPTYGRSFRMIFRWLTIPGTPVISSSEDMTYSQICEELNANGTSIVLDGRSRVPYAYRGDNWITYESETSAAEKAKWIRDNGFGGVMTFSLNADDYRNKCSDKRFAIHMAINRALNS